MHSGRVTPDNAGPTATPLADRQPASPVSQPGQRGRPDDV